MAEEWREGGYDVVEIGTGTAPASPTPPAAEPEESKWPWDEPKEPRVSKA
ncbi:MAG: hypothetical protein WCD72_02650 [Dehalococcoidia bacterium]